MARMMGILMVTARIMATAMAGITFKVGYGSNF
jgi:hypothetical protein